MNTLLKAICFFLVLHMIKCTKPEIHAEKSLMGTWEVDSVYIMYRKANSQSIDSIWKKNYQSGTLTFTSEKAIFLYDIRNNKVAINDDYSIQSFKENAGFFKIRKWRLSVESKLYEIVFGDETKTAHKNADQLRMTIHHTIADTITSEIIYASKP